MSRKIIIASIIFALILGVGGGVWYGLSCQPQATTPKPSAVSHEPEAKEPLAKLVYVGTNETLSEALYHLDLQDGKLDKPYIVHRILEQGPHGEILKQSLQFIGKDGKVKKEEIFESRPSKVDIYITQNGRYAKVLSNFTESVYTIRYYDISGKMLWMAKDTPNSYFVSPDGEIIVEKIIEKTDYRGRSKEYYNLLNSRKEIIKGKFFEVDFSKEKGIYYPGDIMLFSPNGKYFTFRYNFDNGSMFALFNKSGDVVYLKRISNFNIDLEEDKLSDIGDYFIAGHDIRTFYRRIHVYDIQGKELYKRVIKEIMSVKLAILKEPLFFAIAENKNLYLINFLTGDSKLILPFLKLIDVQTCRNLPIISYIEKTNSIQWVYKVAAVKGNRLIDIFREGSEIPKKDQINEYICFNNLIILVQSEDYPIVRAKHIFKIKE